MPRRAQPAKRELLPDPKFHNVTVSTLINKIMTCGKKRTAENIVYGALDILEERSSKDPVTALEQAVKNATPLLEVKPRRVGGATYQVPVEVRSDRRVALGLRWLITAARGRGERTMKDRIATELLEALENRGTAVKKREDTHKMAEANKAFAHYRW
ncbi:MAG: 30S ribosomal protein S7 [Anaerolineales bacterium]|nr:30S ribosomal protein S7 [Anaerolineales bacterium]